MIIIFFSFQVRLIIKVQVEAHLGRPKMEQENSGPPMRSQFVLKWETRHLRYHEQYQSNTETSFYSDCLKSGSPTHLAEYKKGNAAQIRVAEIQNPSRR